MFSLLPLPLLITVGGPCVAMAINDCKVSLNKSIAYSFSLLPCELSYISNARLIISSNAEGHTWYCSGKCSVTYSLMDSLACSRRYCTSETMEVLDTCSSRAISHESNLWLSIQQPLLCATLTVPNMIEMTKNLVLKCQLFAS